MRIPALALAGCAALLAGVPSRSINTFDIPLKDGHAELEWVSPSTFRFARTWGPRAAMRKPFTIQPVAVIVHEEAAGCGLETRYLIVHVDESSGRLRVTTAGGAPLTELVMRRDGIAAALDLTTKPADRFYGLGARTDRVDVRGMRITSNEPFLLSNAGYAVFFPAKGKYVFDVASAAPDRVSVMLPASSGEVLFHFGPAAKETLEEHMGIHGAIEEFSPLDYQQRDPKGTAQPGSWTSLIGQIHALINGSLSAKLVPSFDLSAYAQSDEALYARAAAVASLVPVLYASPSKHPAYERMTALRARLAPYLLSYVREARDRGYPVIRPLMMDFGNDPAVHEHNEQFLLGDELLVAPALNTEGNGKVYLPRGIWTDLRTDETYKGRQEYSVQAAPGDVPMFAKNGTLIPLRPATGDYLELHYFPSLGAEFFLTEETDPEVSQFHAAPAGDVVRLESESKAARVIEWVLHHNAGCREVELGGKPFRRVNNAVQLAPGTWHYDTARKQLRIRLNAAAGGDEIVHIHM